MAVDNQFFNSCPCGRHQEILDLIETQLSKHRSTPQQLSPANMLPGLLYGGYLPNILQIVWQPCAFNLVGLVLGSLQLDFKAFGSDLETIHSLD